MHTTHNWWPLSLSILILQNHKPNVNGQQIYLKSPKINSHQGKLKNHNEISPNPFRMATIQTIETNTSENVDKKYLFYTVSKNVNKSSYWVKQWRDFF